MLGPEHPDVASTLNNWANLLTKKVTRFSRLSYGMVDLVLVHRICVNDLQEASLTTTSISRLKGNPRRGRRFSQATVGRTQYWLGFTSPIRAGIASRLGVGAGQSLEVAGVSRQSERLRGSTLTNNKGTLSWVRWIGRSRPIRFQWPKCASDSWHCLQKTINTPITASCNAKVFKRLS